jgi:hypothetical protein
VDELQVPSDLYPAILTGRAQLLPKGRPLSAQECDVLYCVLAGLMDTNQALRQHAEHMANLVKQWGTMFKGIKSMADRIIDFAHMKEDFDES